MTKAIGMLVVTVLLASCLATTTGRHEERVDDLQAQVERLQTDLEHLLEDLTDEL